MYKILIHKIRQRFAQKSGQPFLTLLLVPIVCATHVFCYTCEAEAQVKYSTASHNATFPIKKIWGTIQAQPHGLKLDFSTTTLPKQVSIPQRKQSGPGHATKPTRPAITS
ncbi:hypothetical protein Pan161_40220 [Gimesia algae]|uniref:Uncharacterized protein n=1 Tax=Gimesia algae TaxID=2527971 RepID=A0A517VH93_9PLAN|nr:hypothetical protein Pan161_40220 [Gimesia algae]